MENKNKTEKVYLTIQSNEALTQDVYKMVLEGDVKAICTPGQFINLKLEGHYLRRPISVCDYDENSVTILYKVVGEGTLQLSRMNKGEVIDTLTGLGNGYDTSLGGDRPMLIGGGVGVPPMYNLCKTLLKEGKNPVVILGFNTQSEIFYEEEFQKLGVDVFVTTVDGSYGIKGFVTDAFEEAGEYTYFYTCGPMPMFRAVNEKTNTSGQFSFEERMGCGFGACMGCTCKTKYGNKRICKDGPVLVKEEIIW